MNEEELFARMSDCTMQATAIILAACDETGKKHAHLALNRADTAVLNKLLRDAATAAQALDNLAAGMPTPKIGP